MVNRIHLIRIVALVATTAAILGTGAMAAWYGRESRACPVSPGERLPDVALSMADGRTWTNAMLQGRRTVLLFTTPTCPACKLDAPEWRARVGNRRAMTFLQVVVGDVAPVASTPSNDVLRDDGQAFVRVLGGSRVPLSILVDDRGIVRSCFVGVQPPDVKERALDRLSGAPPTPHP